MHAHQYLLAPEAACRLAALDIGTNSIRLIVAEPLRDGGYRVLDDERASTRLGRALAATGRLDPQAVVDSLAALRRMQQIATGFQVQRLRAIGTCALREAADGLEFCRRVQEELGLAIEIISSQQEARLAFLSVSRAFDIEGKNVAVADIGGGSTELVLAAGTVIEDVYETPLGAVRLAEMFGSGAELSASGYERMVRYIDAELASRTRGTLLVPHLLIGCGGTFTSLADMLAAQHGRAGMPVRGFEVRRAELRHLLDRLRKLSSRARRSFPGLSPERADIIVPGLAVIDRLLERFRLNRLQVHDGGVRDGLLLTMIDELTGTVPARLDREAAAERFARQCGADVVHSRHVGRLAGEIVAQLAPLAGLTAADRKLVELAAILQDTGYLIDYEQHHKHSYHLIINSRLPGFEPRELELVANIARYHRGARPKRKHENYRRLSKPDRKRVKRLAAILRLAGGLDRSNTQQVEGVRTEVAGEVIRLHVLAACEPELDLWAARRRARPFEKAFKRRLEIKWEPHPPKQEGS
jgi:exopolyphosphatase/guanosine-5'-triphosphate,3'-diphosphate pyrophosphatase